MLAALRPQIQQISHGIAYAPLLRIALMPIVP